MATIFLLIFVGICLVRYKSGKHYSPFYLQLTPDYNIRAFSLSPHGSLREMIQHEARSNIYYFPDYTSGPAAAVALVQAPTTPTPDSIFVTLSESYFGIARTLQLYRTTTTPLKPPDQLPPGAIIYSNPIKHSILPNIPSRCFNWAGDFSFLIVAVTQSVFLTAILHLATITYKAVRLKNPDCKNKQNLYELITTGTLTVLVAIYLVYHLYSTGTEFLMGVNPIETSFAALFAALTLTIPSLWKFSYLCLLKSKLTIAQLSIASLVFLLAMRYLLSGSFPSYQSGDYATYERLGHLIINGHWRDLNNGFYLDRLYAERALLFGAPVALLSTFLPAASHLINFGLIATISIFLFQIIRRQYGIVAAAITSLALNLHPDVLFGGHLCRHDNPSMLYLTIIIFLLANLKDRIWVSEGFTLKNVAKLALATTATGLLLGLIEIQRSYIPFLLVTTTLVLIYPKSPSSPPKSRVTSSTTRFVAALMTIITISLIGIQLSKEIRNFLERKAGPFTTRSLTDNLSALDTTKPGDWESIHSWLANYPPAIPAQNKFEFTRRKLLYEKFSQYEYMPWHIHQKAKSIAGLRSAIRMSGAQQQYEQFPYVFYVPFSSAKFALGFSTTLTLLLLAIVRVLNISRIPPKSFEASFLVFSVTFLSAVLLLSEASEQYDLFVSIPLAINAGVVLSFLFHAKSDEQSGHSRQYNLLDVTTARRLITGALTLTIGTAIYYCIAICVSQRPTLTFARFSNDAQVAGPGTYQADPTRFSIGFNTQNLEANTSISGTTKINYSDLQDNQIRFFLSLDQRNENTTWISSNIEQSDIEYTVSINGEQLHKGPLETLIAPIFISKNFSGREDINITLKMRATTPISSKSNIPSLAIEFIH